MDNFLDDSRGKPIKLIRMGTVIRNEDPNDVGAIKVRIRGTDDKENYGEEVECYPLLPRFFTVLPEVGQGVFIFSLEHRDGLEMTQKSERFWIGPITSQLPDLDKEDYVSGTNAFLSGLSKKGKSFREQPEANGAYPEPDEIAIQGRGDGDIRLRKKETRLTIGKFKNKNRRIFNNTNLGYIQLKSGNEDLVKEYVNEDIKKLVIDPPEFLIRASINSILQDGTILDDNSSQEQFDEATANEILVEKIELKNNTIEGSLSANYDSRFKAVEDLLSLLAQPDPKELNYFEELNGSIDAAIDNGDFDINYNLDGKWQLYSRVTEVLDEYAQGSQSSYETFTVTFPGSEREVTETRKTLKINPSNPKTNTGVDSSIINVVADRINLISHDGNHTFELTDPKNLITDEEQNKIHSKPESGGAQSIVFGEKLVEFLEYIKDYVKLHVHPYHGMPSDPETSKLNVLEFDLETILNKNIKTN